MRKREHRESDSIKTVKVVLKSGLKTKGNNLSSPKTGPIKFFFTKPNI